ncbi:MAG: hypothetical protein AAF307_01430 [Pseudomonadota bacterium]
MKTFALVTACLTILGSGAALAQSAQGASVQVSPGHFCALNKCVRFSSDLQSVSVQGRRAVSVAGYGLANDPVISTAEYRDIFSLALRQSGVNGTR